MCDNKHNASTAPCHVKDDLGVLLINIMCIKLAIDNGGYLCTNRLPREAEMMFH